MGGARGQLEFTSPLQRQRHRAHLGHLTRSESADKWRTTTDSRIRHHPRPGNRGKFHRRESATPAPRSADARSYTRRVNARPVGIVIEEVEDDLSLVRRAFDEVLRPSFESDELPGLETVLDGLEAADQIFCIAKDGPALVGAAVADRAGPGEVALLSYLAVRPGHRGQGTGSALLRHVLDVWTAADIALGLGEIHDPRCHQETESERPIDRLRFYQRHGAGLLIPWTQPALSSSTARVPGMLLIAFPVLDLRVGSACSAGLLRSWTNDYFLECEGKSPISADHPLGPVTNDSDEIPVLPLGDYTSVEPSVA